MIRIYSKLTDTNCNVDITDGAANVFTMHSCDFMIPAEECLLAEEWYPGDSIIYKGFLKHNVDKTGTLVTIKDGGTAVIITGPKDSKTEIPWGRWMFVH